MTQDAIAQTEQQLIDLLRKANGPDVTIEIVTRRTIAPPSAERQRPLLTMLGDEILLSDAVRVTGLSKRTLLRYADAGRFRLVQRAGNRWVMQKADVERLAEEMRRR